MHNEIVTLDKLVKQVLDNNKDAVRRNLMNLGLIDGSFMLDYDSFLNVINQYEIQHNANGQQLAELTAAALDVPINRHGFGATWLVMVENLNATKLSTIVAKTAQLTFANAEKAVGTNKSTVITADSKEEYRNRVITWLVISLLILAAIGGLTVFLRGLSKIIKSS